MLAKWGTPSLKLRGTLDTIWLFTLCPMMFHSGNSNPSRHWSSSMFHLLQQEVLTTETWTKVDKLASCLPWKGNQSLQTWTNSIRRRDCRAFWARRSLLASSVSLRRNYARLGFQDHFVTCEAEIGKLENDFSRIARLSARVTQSASFFLANILRLAVIIKIQFRPEAKRSDSARR
jgi:hypothetical protein